MDKEIDIETRLMMAEVGLKVADSMIHALNRKLNALIAENKNR